MGRIRKLRQEIWPPGNQHVMCPDEPADFDTWDVTFKQSIVYSIHTRPRQQTEEEIRRLKECDKSEPAPTDLFKIDNDCYKARCAMLYSKGRQTWDRHEQARGSFGLGWLSVQGRQRGKSISVETFEKLRDPAYCKA